MQLTRRTKVIIVVVSLATSFAFGRYSVPEKIKIETKIVEVEKKTDDKKIIDKEKKHVKTITTETDKPDGTKVITSVTTDDSIEDDKTTDVSTDDIKKDTDTVKEVTKGSSKVTVAALGGIDFTNGHYIFGASVDKPLLGPITFGLFGFSDLRFGISLGLQF